MKTKKKRKSSYKRGEACHDCGLPLNDVVGVSRTYLQCANKHVTTRKQICGTGSCRRIARQVGWNRRRGHWAACDEHAP